MTTRRQHYVCQAYLEAWATPKGKAHQLWCLRRPDPEPFFTDVKNVAVERDFYRVHDLEEGDAAFVRWLAINPKTNPKMRDLAEGWISRMETFLNLMQSAKAAVSSSERLLAELDAEMIEFQENEYSRLESDAANQLEALRQGDVSFFDDVDQAMHFSYFLAQQYFRTKAIRDRIRITFATPAEKERFERTWPIFRYIYSTNIGYSIFANRKTMKLQVVQAADEMEFITADQPAINTHGAFISPNTPVEELELFYPVSPSRAAIISGHTIYQDIHGQQLAPLRTHYFNQTIEHVAYKCLFAKSDGVLRAAAPHFCSKDKAL
jgi:hypothetical protein